MSKNYSNSTKFFIISILVFTVLSYAGNKNAVAEKNEIVFGEVMDLSGPAAALGLDVHNARLDVIRDANEKGGIEGHKIKLISVDCSYDLSKEMAAYRRFIEVDKVHAILAFHSVTPFQMKEEMIKKGVVAFGTQDIKNLLPPSNTFSGFATYIDQYRCAMKWMSDTWKKEKPLKYAYLTLDVGHSRSYVPALKLLAQKLPNVEYANEYFTSRAAIDFSTEIAKMNNANIDWVMIHHTDTSLIAFMKDCARLNFKGKVMALLSMANPKVIEACGPAAEGAYVVIPTPTWNETDIPGIKLAHEFIKKHHPDLAIKGPGPWYQTFLSDIMVVKEVTKITLKKVGYDKLNGSAIIDVLLSGKTFDTMGLLPPIKFTNSYHGPSPTFSKVVQVKNGTIVAISDWIEAPPKEAKELKLDFYKY
jgi:branched-chain amino acid transport system substrate-binding protein